MMGGGALPGEKIPSFAVTVVPGRESCESLAERLRRLPVPVIVYIRENRIFADMRTVMPEDKEMLLNGLKQCLTQQKEEI